MRLVLEPLVRVNLEYQFGIILLHLDIKFGITSASLKQLRNILHPSNSMKVKTWATEEIYPTRTMIQNRKTAKASEDSKFSKEVTFKLILGKL